MGWRVDAAPTVAAPPTSTSSAATSTAAQANSTAAAMPTAKKARRPVRAILVVESYNNNISRPAARERAPKRKNKTRTSAPPRHSPFAIIESSPFPRQAHSRRPRRALARRANTHVHTNNTGTPRTRSRAQQHHPRLMQDRQKGPMTTSTHRRAAEQQRTRCASGAGQPGGVAENSQRARRCSRGVAVSAAKTHNRDGVQKWLFRTERRGPSHPVLSGLEQLRLQRLPKRLQRVS
jgi:hypothetical protein